MGSPGSPTHRGLRPGRLPVLGPGPRRRGGHRQRRPGVEAHELGTRLTLPVPDAVTAVRTVVVGPHRPRGLVPHRRSGRFRIPQRLVRVSAVSGPLDHPGRLERPSRLNAARHIRGEITRLLRSRDVVGPHSYRPARREPVVDHRPSPARRVQQRTDREELARPISRQRRCHRGEPVTDPPRDGADRSEPPGAAEHDDRRPEPIEMKHLPPSRRAIRLHHGLRPPPNRQFHPPPAPCP